MAFAVLGEIRTQKSSFWEYLFYVPHIQPACGENGALAHTSCCTCPQPGSLIIATPPRFEVCQIGLE